jgi:hypothetical protein
MIDQLILIEPYLSLLGHCAHPAYHTCYYHFLTLEKGRYAAIRLDNCI